MPKEVDLQTKAALIAKRRYEGTSFEKLGQIFGVNRHTAAKWCSDSDKKNEESVETQKVLEDMLEEQNKNNLTKALVDVGVNNRRIAERINWLLSQEQYQAVVNGIDKYLKIHGFYAPISQDLTSDREKIDAPILILPHNKRHESED